MEVPRVRPGPQGGKDLIARTWVLDEPITMAVEIKHKNTVKPGEVRDAMFASQYYNSLMFVTSGGFAAGVLRERATYNSHMRLILKDGVALRGYP